MNFETSPLPRRSPFLDHSNLHILATYLYKYSDIWPEGILREANLAMTNDESRFDEIGYWSEIKLEILKNYATF
jgi:hypothetical protein